MTTLKRKQKKFLNDTIKHFNSKNRSHKFGQCQYSPIKGKSDGCAIGRHIKDKELCKRLDACVGIDDAAVESPKTFKVLPKNLKALGKIFLSEIQKLHDGETYWDKNGLSDFGELRVQEIKKRFKLN